MRNRPRDFRRRTLALLFIWLASAASGWGASDATRDLSEFFGAREGCFVLYDAQKDACLRFNPQGCAQRFSPCSTFKIASTLIALDTGVVSGPEFPLKWDGIKRPIASWNRDHTLRSAIQYSVVWFFQEVARRIGPERMAECVRKLDYGNGDTSGGATNFWLNSSLRLSADEQVRFLRRLWADRLPVSQEAQRLTRELLELSRSEDGRVLYGKTGTAGDPQADIASLGWFVGCVSRDERRYFFATRITGARDASGRQARQITEAILAKLKI